MTRRTLITTVLVTTCLGAPLAFAQELPLITGTDGPDTLNGGAASESIYGRGGNDTISGGGGNDELDGGSGADVLSGGLGDDVISYEGPAALAVTLDDVGNDGATGENDNVRRDVEDIFGADGNDRLTGSSADNTIDGGAGDDLINGGTGRDSLFGGDGRDRISARDGEQDRVDCGGGNDRAEVDVADIKVGCETVISGPSKDFSVFTAAFIGPRLKSLTLRGVVNGSRVRIACYSGCKGAARSRAIVSRTVKPRGLRVLINLPGRPAIPTSKAEFEIGVRNPGAQTRCIRYRISKRKVRRLPVSCRTAARA